MVLARFVKFVPTRGHTGHQLANLLFEFIEDNGIISKKNKAKKLELRINPIFMLLQWNQFERSPREIL